MSVTTETNRTAELTTNGVVTEFDFDMLIHADSEVQVYYKPAGGDYSLLTLDTHYTVVFTEDGGTVTTIGVDSPYVAGKLLIIRHLPLTQLTNWLYNDNHTEQTHQDDFDRSVMRDLQIQEQLDRCIGFAIYTLAADIAPNDGNFIVGDGSDWIVESGNIARTSLGLGTGDSPTLAGLTIGSATAHDPTLTFASQGADGIIQWEDTGDYFKINADIDIDGFIMTEFLYLSSVIPGIEFEVDDTIIYMADTWEYYIASALEYSFSATEFNAQSNDITTTGTLTATTIGAFQATGAIDFNDQDMDNVDIDSGTIDGVTIGATVAPTITDLGSVAACDINGGTLAGITIDGNWTAAGQTCADLGTITTADINGGTLDGVALGATCTQAEWDTAYGWGDHASGGYLKANGTVPLTANWDAGAREIKARWFEFSTHISDGTYALGSAEFQYLDGQNQHVKTTSSPTFVGITLSANLDMQDDDKILLGTGDDGEIYVSGDNLYIANVRQDKDIYIKFYDGAVLKTLQIDASDNIFDFGDTALHTTGAMTAATVDGRDIAADGALLDTALQDVVDDTTPQLGGDLDGQSTYDLTNIVDAEFEGAVGIGGVADSAKGIYIHPSPTASYTGIDVTYKINPAAAAQTVKGMEFTLLATTSSENLSGIIGLMGNAGADNTGYTGDVTTVTGVQGAVMNIANGCTFTDAYIFRGSAMSVGLGGAITTGYGLYLPDVSAAGTAYAIYTAGDVPCYFTGDITAKSYTDNTPAFVGASRDALDGILTIKKDAEGKIDHSTLPEFARGTAIEQRPTGEKRVEIIGGVEIEVDITEPVEIPTRDIGAMVTLLTESVKELNARVKMLEAA